MKKPFVWGSRTYLMGIINLTPDSFSGDGLITTGDYVEKAFLQAKQFIAEGADILDLGAESSRPGSEPINAEKELQRLLPALTAIRKENPDAFISVDTYKSQVAEEALIAGADWINDIWGLKADEQMASVVARHAATIILMHNRWDTGTVEKQGALGSRFINTQYADIVSEVKQGLEESVAIAKMSGVHEDKIILDPGIGFGKNLEQNLELIDRLNEIKTLNYPLLAGPSRKSFIGYTLNLPPDQRLEGTAAAVAISIARGADIVRVHDVQAMVRVARMCDAILR